MANIFNTKRTRISTRRNSNQLTLIVCFSILILLGLILIIRYFGYVHAQNNTDSNLADAKKMEALFFQQTFYDGVSVENISLAGKTKEEARQLLADGLKDKFVSPKVTLTFKDKNWVFDQKYFLTAIDLEDALDRAWKVGRTGDDAQRKAEIEKAKSEGINISAAIIQNPEFLKTELNEIKSAIDTPMKPAAVNFKYDNGPQFNYSDEQMGYNLDVDAAYREITEKLQTSSFFTYQLKPEEIKPTNKKGDLQRNYVKISSFKTYYGDSGTGRRTNINLALAVFNEKTLMPGETLSFNQWVGERTAEKGYQMAVFINSDQVYDEAAGGGICQVSTTLYNAALLAGANARGKNAPIEIVERYPHSWPSVYAAAGLDASVNWPQADIKLRNNNAAPIFFHTYHDKNYVNVEIYGEALPNNASIQIETVQIEKKDPPPVVEVKDTNNKYKLAPGDKKQVSNSRPGYTIETYQIWNEPGKEPVRTLINTTVYKPISGKIYVGVG